MGDLYVSEAFQECCFITVTATGLGAPGLVPTCTAIRRLELVVFRKDDVLVVRKLA